jgi:hypothetical protein
MQDCPVPEEPKKHPVPSPPTPDPATEPRPTVPKKERPLGIVGWLVAIFAVPIVVAAFLASCIGPMYLYIGLVQVSAGRPWLYWAGLPVLALLCLLGWLLRWLARSSGKDKK